MAPRSASSITRMARTGPSSLCPGAPSSSACRTAQILASGPIVSLMDMATSIAVWLRLGRFRPQATLDLRVDYLRPAAPGRTVIGRGTCYRVTRSIAFVRGIAHDGDPDDPVANVTGTFIGTD